MDPVQRIHEAVRHKAAALEDISGTAGLAAIFEVLRDLEVGIMREAFQQRQDGAPRWEYYAGLRDGVVNVAQALRATVEEGEALREQDDGADEEVGADDLGITFGGGNLS